MNQGKFDFQQPFVSRYFLDLNVNTLPPVVHAADPITSFKAEDKANKKFRVSHAIRVLDAVKLSPGLNALELADALEMREYAVRRRLSDLKAAGKVKINGERDGNSCWWPA